MNRFVIAIAVILVIAGGVYFYTSQQSSTLPTASTEESTSTDSATEPSSTTPTETTSSTANETSTTETAVTETSTSALPAREGEIPPHPKVLGVKDGLSHLGTPGGKIVVATVTGPKTLNDLVGQETTTTNITNRMHAGLVEINAITFEVEPGLATDWEFSEDKKSIVFNLRQGVKFSDGHPFTADDVVFTFNDLIFNDDVNNSTRDILTVKGEPLQVEKLDEYTVKVTMVEPFRPLLRAIGANILPQHLLAGKVAKLNPGVRGVMKFVEQTLASHREALAALSVDSVNDVEALGWALTDLEDAIEAKDAGKVGVVATSLNAHLDNLISSLPEDEEELGTVLASALSQAQQIGAYSKNGLWEGIAAGTFNNAWSVDTPADQLAGLGAYVFVRYDVDQQVIMERNLHYWKVDENGVQLPYIEQLVVLVVENTNTATLKFKTGETDTLFPQPEDWPTFFEGVDTDNECTQTVDTLICQNKAEGWKMLRGGPQFGTAFISFNQDAKNPALKAVFRDLKFRKAMAYAFDKASMIDNIYNGLAIPQWSPVSVPSPYYAPDSLVLYPYDLETAAGLLDETGLVDIDGDGVRNITDAYLQNAGVNLDDLPQEAQNEADRELEFIYVTFTGSDTVEKLSNMIVSDMKKIGVNPAYRPIDFNALVTDLFGGNFEAMFIGFTGGVEPYNGANVWTTGGNLHFWRYSSADDPPEWEQRVDELFDLAATTFDEVKVKEYFEEFQRLVSDNLPWIYTVNRQFTYIYKDTLTNTDKFQPIPGNTPTVFAFLDMLWWDDEDRRGVVDVVRAQ